MALKLRESVYDAETEYGVALLDGDSGEYFELNPTGALVVRVLLGGGTADAAAGALVAEYGIEPGIAARDVGELLAELRAARLIDEEPQR